MNVPNTDPIPQPAGVPEITANQVAPVTTAGEAEAATNPDDERVGTDLDTTEGQAQAQPIGGEAAVYEPAGDEDDDLIEGGEEYEEGDYDDELDPDGAVEGGEGESGDLLSAEEVVDPTGDGVAEGEVEGEDGDPYGVDGFVNGLDGDAADEGDVVEDEEYEEYEDEADPELGAEGEGMSLPKPRSAANSQFMKLKLNLLLKSKLMLLSMPKNRVADMQSTRMMNLVFRGTKKH